MSASSTTRTPSRSGGSSCTESKDFFQRVFQLAATDRSSLEEEDERVIVEDVEIEGENNLGENYGSALVFANVKLRSRKDLKNVGVVIKFLKHTRWHVEMMNIYELFKKEEEFYNKTVPAMAIFQAERGVRRLMTELVPKCLFARAAGDEQIVITENLRQKGFRMADRHRGLGLRHSILALEALGHFHAASLAMKILEPEVFWEASRNVSREADYNEKRKTIYDTFYRQISRGKVKSLIASEVKKGAVDSDLLLRVSEVAEKVIEERAQLSLDVLQRYREPLAVINHGDFWVNNIMYRYEKNERGEEVPVAVKFVDFQMTRYGSPSLDLHTFLYTSTTLRLRREHEEHLLRAYHGSLLDGLREAGVDLERLSKRIPGETLNGDETEKEGRGGDSDPPDSHPLSFRALKEDLNRHWPWGIMVAELMLRVVLGDSSDAENSIEATMTSSNKAKDYGEEEEKIVGYEMLKQLTSKAYDERYLEVIREYAHKGFLGNENVYYYSV